MDYEDTNREIDQRRVLPVPFVVLLDLDRCLLDTNAFIRAFYDALEPGLAKALRHAQEGIEASGGSFDLVETIKERVDEPEWRAIRSYFFEASNGATFLYNGARELMTWLQTRKVPFAIITYGGEEWQCLKQRTARLERVPMIVVDTSAKGKIIDSWRDSDGLFRLPVEHVALPPSAHRIVLVDDKAVAFQGMPEGSVGIQVVIGEKPPSIQQGDLPSGVRVAHGLDVVRGELARLVDGK